jgi:hypothetical protein
LFPTIAEVYQPSNFIIDMLELDALECHELEKVQGHVGFLPFFHVYALLLLSSAATAV